MTFADRLLLAAAPRAANQGKPISSEPGLRPGDRHNRFGHLFERCPAKYLARHLAGRGAERAALVVRASQIFLAKPH